MPRRCKMRRVNKPFGEGLSLPLVVVGVGADLVYFVPQRGKIRKGKWFVVGVAQQRRRVQCCHKQRALLVKKDTVFLHDCKLWVNHLHCRNAP